MAAPNTRIHIKIYKKTQNKKSIQKYSSVIW